MGAEFGAFVGMDNDLSGAGIRDAALGVAKAALKNILLVIVVDDTKSHVEKLFSFQCASREEDCDFQGW